MDVEAALDNPVWHALTGPQSMFAEGAGPARRYQPDVSVFAACDGLDEQSWAALADLVGPRGVPVLMRTDWIDPPAGWKVLFVGQAYQMVLDEAPKVGASAEPIEPLNADDVPAMLGLIKLTEPGPFSERTIQLGTYLGVKDEGRLIAMAGERIHLDGATEVSAVCTHPDARRRGLGATLTAEVALRIQARGELPFLHVLYENTGARSVYEKMGFRTRRMSEARAFGIAR